jgi:hypothetical protein
VAIKPPAEKDKKMTTAAEMTDKEKAKLRDKEMAEREKVLNAGKTGKGTRTFLGMTRGRNPQEIQFENWDETLKDTLPTSISEFMTLTGITDDIEGEKQIVRRLILGDNEVLYKEASDVTAEFVDSSWPVDVQKQFKIVVKNYADGANVSIEDAANLIKPGFAAGVAKSAKS